MDLGERILQIQHLSASMVAHLLPDAIFSPIRLADSVIHANSATLEARITRSLRNSSKVRLPL